MVEKAFFGENKNIEYKREIPKKHEKFLKDVIAFSNCTGGKIHAFNLMTENKIKYAKIKCALFKGVERDEFIDRKEFGGPIYQQIDDAYKFVLRHINKSAEINGIVRRDIYELPTRAVREAIVNAVTHRSYLDDSCIQVSVFDDRVEIVSPGMLYGGLDMKAALEGKSKCRNAAISEAFYYMGIVEAWGTGLGRIQKSCREHNLQEPVIEEFGDGFRVVFFRRRRINSKDNSEMRGNDETTYLSSAEKTASDIESSTEKTANNIESSIETEKRSMETIENRLIKLLLKEPEITQQQAANQLGYSKAWIRKNMEKLQRDGIIYREGSTKKGRWIVLQ